MRKILLSALMVLCLSIGVVNVKAVDDPDNTVTDPSTSQTTDPAQGSGNTGDSADAGQDTPEVTYPTYEEVQAEITEAFGDKITVSKTMTEAANATFNLTEGEDPLETELRAIIIDKVKSLGYENPEIQSFWVNSQGVYTDHVGFTVIVKALFAENDERNVNVSIDDLPIEYAVEANRNADDAAFVSKLILSLKFDYSENYGEGATYFTLFNQTITDVKKSIDYVTKYVKDQITDKTITTATTVEYFEEGSYASIVVYLYKNGVLYNAVPVGLSTSRMIANDKGHIVISNNTEYIDEDEDLTNMVAEMKKKGFKDIIGAYYINAIDYEVNEKTTIPVYVGAEYNGKYVSFLHLKDDGKYEWLQGIVSNGTVNITVSSLSPFVAALGTYTNNAQTSGVDVVFYGSVSLISLLGISYLLISKKKRA